MSATGKNLYAEILRLLRPFWAMTLIASGMGVAAGLAAAWLLATINAGLHAPDGPGFSILLRLAALVALSVIGTAIAGVGNSMIGQRVIAALRKDISARILKAPIAAIERARAHSLLATLNNDVDTISVFTFNASGYAIALAITIGGFVYLFVLSPGVFLIALAALVLGATINIVAKRGWIRDYEGVRDAQGELQKQYRAITEGAKELRLARERRQRVHGLLLSGAADRIAALKIRAMRLFWIADAAGSAIFFVVIGVLLATERRLGIDPAVISGAILVLLYVKGPVEQLAAGLPMLIQAQVAFRRIAILVDDFSHDDGGAGGGGPPIALRSTLELRGVRYEYPQSSFAVGPIDLRIQRGETLFIVGENGSGKTTLIKLLLGLYAPQSGEILVDGAHISEDRLDDYRQLFSAVFSDYFLFDDLVADDDATVSQAMHFLDRLEIADKLELRAGAFTTIDLSGGQRKRLALVHAWLERRPVMMFDEWAADQDPTFRRVFYRELLPELKRLGKTLIVVSHDDRYFDCADRILQLHGGKVVEDRYVVPASEAHQTLPS